ncbi:uncharacterized protein LOC141614073 [Silene latifolia]|uniref:uncharacterized protein LOC141614073 n=1 Tax=Silene latifolia TaxID=37657 RepID=UPI003D786E21
MAMSQSESSKSAELRAFNLDKELSTITKHQSTDDEGWTEVHRKRGQPSTTTNNGANPPASVLDGFVRRVWKQFSIDKVSFLMNGICLIRFLKPEDKETVLQSGPLFFDNKPFIINDWKPDSNLRKEKPDHVVVWVRLYDLDFKYWGAALPKIIGLIGNPLRCDRATKEREFLRFARYMVEVKLGQHLPDAVEFIDEKGVVQVQKVHYEWKPLACTKCHGVGHDIDMCKKADGVKKTVFMKVWRPKVVPVQPVQTTAQVHQHQRKASVEGPLPTLDPASVVTLMPYQGTMLNSITPSRFLQKRGFFGLIETRVRAINVNKVQQNLGFKWHFIVNNDIKGKGRIWVLWDPYQFAVVEIGMELQVIHLKVTHLPSGFTWVNSMIYGCNKDHERKELWSSLIQLKTGLTDPWLIMGDSNNVLHYNEPIRSPVSMAEDGSARVFSRIDRVMANDMWILNGPSGAINFLPEGLFVHSPCLVELWNDCTRRKASFNYFNMWGKDDNFLSILQQIWDKQVRGYMLFQVVKKLKYLKAPLKTLNKEGYGDILNSAQVASMVLAEVQSRLHQTPTDSLVQAEERIAAKACHDIETTRNIFLAQKAKVMWMNCADENAHYFHSHIKARRSLNKILSVKDKTGQAQALDMCRIVSKEETKLALFSIPIEKAPGTDGFSSGFFKDSFSVIGEDVCTGVQEFFSNGKLLQQINVTVLTLIPKKDSPGSVLDFRPIACCSVLYKCISKVIYNRLSPTLANIVSLNQSAFIHGRDIVDNIMICQDLVRLYNRKNCSPRLLMKIDLRKAYDSIEWEFVEDMLCALKFPCQMVNWIMQCVSSPTYSISLNEAQFGYFKGRRGLRQADPMSPLLFTLCMEYLTRILAVGDRSSVKVLIRAFLTFSEASGLAMNQEKSEIYMNGVPPLEAEAILHLSGFQVGHFPFKYLGIPISYKKISNAECNILVDRIVTRIRSWGAKKLSYAARLVLVRSVLSQMHSYWARIFLLPKGIISRVDAVCRNYLWSRTDDFHRIPAVAWDTCCLPKDRGGLGILHCLLWNLVVIGKFSWWIAQKKDSLWVKWVHHIYMKQSDCLNGWLNEDYSTHGVYIWLIREHVTVNWMPLVWNRLCLPKVNFICWLYVLNRFMTKERLVRYGVISSDLCDLCGTAQETHYHLFFDCSYSQRCLLLLKQWLAIDWNGDLTIWILSWRCRTLLRKKVIMAALATLIYHIWQNRNTSRHEGLVQYPAAVLRWIKAYLKGRFLQVKESTRLSSSWIDNEDLA